MANEEWGTIAAITYFSLYVVLLIIISILAHKNEYHATKKSLFKSIWNKRGIYGQILVHLYDTATDIGVLIQWGILAQQEKTGGQNIKSLDMNSLFWTSIAFLIGYRVRSSLITPSVSSNSMELVYQSNIRIVARIEHNIVDLQTPIAYTTSDQSIQTTNNYKNITMKQ
eukprot:37325_1